MLYMKVLEEILRILITSQKKISGDDGCSLNWLWQSLNDVSEIIMLYTSNLYSTVQQYI